MKILSNRRIRLWSYVFFWTSLIYSTLYVVRPICTFLKKYTPFVLITNILFSILIIIILFLFFKKLKIKKSSNYLLLFINIFLYILGMFVIKYPEEKIHLIEYGILAHLIYKACSLDFSRKISYFLSFFITSGLGWIDEGIQYILPNRYYSIDDVILNSVSGILALFLIFIVERLQ